MPARREAKSGEVAVHVAHRPAPGAHQVTMGAGRRVETSRACPHVELLDPNQCHQVVDGLVDGGQRDRRHLLTEGLEYGMGDRMGAVSVQDPENALALRSHLETPIPDSWVDSVVVFMLLPEQQLWLHGNDRGRGPRVTHLRAPNLAIP